ncbi:MAG: hypothetical protein KJ607_14885, partial [Bacteroidetes bacterium]|nr:hypothetical protein [Bacteroidota bacterium]
MRYPDSALNTGFQALERCNRALTEDCDKNIHDTLLILKSDVLGWIGYIYGYTGNMTKSLEFLNDFDFILVGICFCNISGKKMQKFHKNSALRIFDNG